MKKIFLILIILLGFALRFYRLDTYPALNADEAAIGYNAYSLIQTGKDEHGNPWPIHFQSFNDYKPGLYFYIVLPFVKFLGLNEWAVRIPGALFGVFTIYAIYLLVKELFEDERLALVSALFLAISPWHIHFSRGGWEVNVATFFITLGTYFLIKFASSGKGLYYSILSFVASLYTYHAARVVAPLLVLGLVIYYRNSFISRWKQVLVAVILGLILVTPLVLDLARPEITSRAAGVGLFADPGPKSRVEEQRGEHEDFSAKFPKLLHNKAVNYGLAFFKNWTDHYWGEFLFLSGDVIQRNRVPETGQTYMFDVVLVVVAFWFIIKSSKNWFPIIWWLLIAPTAAALTFQSPHALRAQNMVVPLVIIAAFGLTKLIDLTKEKINIKVLRKIAFMVIGLIIVWGFARYLHMYWDHMAKEYPYSSQYGVKELVSYVTENQDKYKKILVTDRYDQPYILFLFYMKYDPAKFQADHNLTPRDKFGFSTVNRFGKYYFSSIKFDEARPENPNTMIVGTDGEIPDETNVLKNIYGSNGFLYFQVVGN